MTTAQLINVLSDPTKHDFVKGYYQSVLDGLKESNASISRHFLYSSLVIVLYYAFGMNLIVRISVAQVDIDNSLLLKIATPLLASFFYYLMISNMVRYYNLRVQYDALLYYFTGDKSFREGESKLHYPILSANSVDFAFHYLLDFQNLKQFVLGCLLSIPLLGFLLFILYFNFMVISRMPFREMCVVSCVVSFVSGVLILVSMTISYIGNKNKIRDRRLVIEFIDGFKVQSGK